MEIIYHPSDFNIADCIDRFWIDYHPPFNNQIRNIVIDLVPFVENGINGLLRITDILNPELNTERPLIGLLSKTMPRFIQSLHGTTNDLKNQFLFQ